VLKIFLRYLVNALKYLYMNCISALRQYDLRLDPGSVKCSLAINLQQSLTAVCCEVRSKYSTFAYFRASEKGFRDRHHAVHLISLNLRWAS